MTPIKVLSLPIHPTSYEAATQIVLQRAEAGAGGYVCAANVHMTVLAGGDTVFAQAVQGATLVVPDGMPIVWMMRRLGAPHQGRVYGPELMLHICQEAARKRLPVGLYGSTAAIARKLRKSLQEKFAALQIPLAVAPGDITSPERVDADAVAQIKASGAKIVFVGLGCPKQELWMGTHSPHLGCVLVGVGAAFDLHAGAVPQAPALLKRNGLEWLFRLALEPRRLAPRYIGTNPKFLVSAAAQLLAKWRQGI